jgi:multidrug efflux pump subunit AcrB
VNVQNRVAKAINQLPVEVVQAGISTQKVQNSFIMFCAVSSEDSTKYDELFLENYIKISLIPQVQRVPGVAQALVFGTKDYAMRIWLKPDRLIANDLSPQDVLTLSKIKTWKQHPDDWDKAVRKHLSMYLSIKGN